MAAQMSEGDAVVRVAHPVVRDECTVLMRERLPQYRNLLSIREGKEARAEKPVVVNADFPLADVQRDVRAR